MIAGYHRDENGHQGKLVPVSVVARTTPSPGTEASFMQQLLGNIGKFNAAPASPTAGGAGPSSGPGI